MDELLREVQVHLVRVRLELILTHGERGVLRRREAFQLFPRLVERRGDILVPEPTRPIRRRAPILALLRGVRAAPQQLSNLHVSSLPRRGHERGGPRSRVRDADERAFPGARASCADAPNGVQQRVERLVRALEEGVHDGRLHGLALGAVRVRGGCVSNGSGAEASAAAEPDGGENILEVVIRHGVGVPGHANHGTPAEVVAEEALAHGGGHEHQSEVRMPGHGGAEDDCEKIGKEIPLVQLVDDDVRETGEHRVRPGARQPTQQHAVRAKQQRRVRPSLVLQTNLVSHRALADVFASLRRHALRHRHRGDAPRLRAHDGGAATLGPRVVDQILRHLSRLAAPGRAGDQHNLVRLHRIENRTLKLVHGEVGARALDR